MPICWHVRFWVIPAGILLEKSVDGMSRAPSKLVYTWNEFVPWVCASSRFFYMRNEYLFVSRFSYVSIFKTLSHSSVSPLIHGTFEYISMDQYNIEAMRMITSVPSGCHAVCSYIASIDGTGSKVQNYYSLISAGSLINNHSSSWIACWPVLSSALNQSLHGMPREPYRGSKAEVKHKVLTNIRKFIQLGSSSQLFV